MRCIGAMDYDSIAFETRCQIKRGKKSNAKEQRLLSTADFENN
jgi:hypothetical protein